MIFAFRQGARNRALQGYDPVCEEQIIAKFRRSRGFILLRPFRQYGVPGEYAADQAGKQKAAPKRRLVSVAVDELFRCRTWPSDGSRRLADQQCARKWQSGWLAG